VINKSRSFIIKSNRLIFIQRSENVLAEHLLLFSRILAASQELKNTLWH